MAGILSKNIKLYYDSSSTSTPSWVALTNLQSIPDLGGDVEKVEVTTLDDAAHMYINGIKNYGDSLEFTFLYDPAQFETLNNFTGVKSWKVELNDAASKTGASPANTVCTFSGECHVKLNGIGVNEALLYTLSIAPNTAMSFTI